MAKVKEIKWYAKQEFTCYGTFTFWKDQEIKGLTPEQVTGLNDLIYSKETDTDLETIEEKKGDKK